MLPYAHVRRAAQVSDSTQSRYFASCDRFSFVVDDSCQSSLQTVASYYFVATSAHFDATLRVLDDATRHAHAHALYATPSTLTTEEDPIGEAKVTGALFLFAEQVITTPRNFLLFFQKMK